MVLTSIEVSDETYKEIKSKGMTLRGAFREGWKALQERPATNEHIRQLEENIRKYQRRLAELV